MKGLGSIIHNSKYAVFPVDFDYLDEKKTEFIFDKIEFPINFNILEDYRKKQFVATRFALIQLLDEQNVKNYKLKLNKQGNLIYPEGIVGDITCSKKTCIAIISQDEDILSVGIDLIQRKSINPSVKDIIITDQDYLDCGEMVLRDVYGLIFSAKECLFKVLDKFVQKKYYFKKIAVTDINEDEKTFTIKILSDIDHVFKKNMTFNGKYLADEEHIVTVIELYDFL